MERAANILGGALRQLKRPEAALAWLTAAWSGIVGQPLAAHTRPLRYHAGCLEILTEGKAWQQQLESMSGEFRARVNREWGGNLVTEVRFAAAAPRKQASREFDNEHTPFVRRGKS